MNGAQWLVQRLRSAGVEQVFVLCGNGLNPFLDACLDYNLKIFDVRNEQAAAFMADAWGRFTRKLGVVAVSSGPGHTNALTGLSNSWWDGGPMLLISGCSEHRTRGRGNFQEIDQVGMASPVCKYAKIVNSIETLQMETENAVNAAVSGRPGPAHLTIPIDVLSAPISVSNRISGSNLSAVVSPQGAGERRLVEKAAALLAKAERPIMIAGSGAFYADAWPVIKRFAGRTNIPLYSMLWDRGCVEEAIPQFVGIVSTEVNAAAERIRSADVILTIGARVDYRLTYGLPPVVSESAAFIRIDADPAELACGLKPEVGIVGSPAAVLRQIDEAPQSACLDFSGWLSEIVDHRRASLGKWLAALTDGGIPISSLRLCRELSVFLKQDITFLLDGGNIGRWAHMLFFDRHPSYWFTCGLSGVIGWGIPGAAALKLARPDKPLLLLSGDGSAGFTVSEIQTAVRFGFSYVAVVAHDSAWGIVADEQPDGRHAGSELGEIRFDRVAEAFGARGVYIDDAGEIAPAVQEGFASKAPTFIHVPTLGYGIKSYREKYLS